MNHIGADAVIANMMIHSLSPQGRRLVEQMYTGDPFHIDIKLNSDSRNRSAEIANTYLKTIGRRLVFIKKKKHYERMHISPFYFDKSPVIKPISILPESRRKGFDFLKDYEEMEKTAALKKEKGISPVSFDSRSRDPRKKKSFD